MKVLALYSLSSGATLKTVEAPWYRHDLRLFQDLWPEFSPGDIALGDRAFGAYVSMAMLPLRGVDVVSRLHQSRRFHRRRAKKIGPSEWLVTWTRPPKRPDYLRAKEWAAAPSQITVRLIHSGIDSVGKSSWCLNGSNKSPNWDIRPSTTTKVHRLGCMGSSW
jgi:hypothetical protein